MRPDSVKTAEELRIRRLAVSLRDEGRQPPRDLWPAIDAAIDRAEALRLPSRRRRWLPAAAVAAALALALLGAPRLRPDARLGTNLPPTSAAMLELDRALADLDAALADDPDNASLVRLVLLVQRTRGDLLRRAPTAGPWAG